MTFSTRFLDEYRAEIRLDIGCPGGALLLWEDTELNRCVERAVEVVSRFYPQQLAYEHTIDYTVTAEVSNSVAAGTAKGLTYKPIKPESETITSNPVGTTYVRDTDYTMDYINGEYTKISVANGGSIGDGAGISLLVTYTKSRIGLDISAIITDLIRIDRVEYPADRVPQTKVPFNAWGDFLYLESIEPGESQAEVTDKEHVVIYYEKKHDAPTDTTAPTYPAFLDEVVCLGAVGYALLSKAINTYHQAVNEFASARTELTTIAHLNTEAALGHVDTYSGGDTAPSAKKYLDDGDGGLTNLAVTVGKGYLSTGAGFINTVNVGDRVAENYGTYGSAFAALESILARRAELYATYAARSNDISTAFLAVAMQRTAINQVHLAGAENYITLAVQNMMLAERFRAEGIERRNEFWATLRDPKQYMPDWSSTSVRQTSR